MLQQSVFQFCGVFHRLSFDKNGRSVHINHRMNANPGWFALCWLRSHSIEQWGEREGKKRREMEWALSCWKGTNPLQLWKTFSSLRERARLKSQADRLMSRVLTLENWICNSGPSISPSEPLSSDTVLVLVPGAWSETILHNAAAKRWL